MNRKYKVGAVIVTQGIRALRAHDGKPVWFWFEVPPGMSREEALEEAANTPALHGPFDSKTECDRDRDLTVLGPDCKVTRCGEWDPSWGDIRDFLNNRQ
jgi:hypothetical protein